MPIHHPSNPRLGRRLLGTKVKKEGIIAPTINVTVILSREISPLLNVRKMSLENLKKALSLNISEENAESLAKILDMGSKEEKISYTDVEKSTDDPEGLLLLAEEKKLLIPTRTSRSKSWEDRVLLFEPGEYYEMPKVVKYLVKNARETGEWNPKKVTAELFRKMGEEDSDQMPELIERMKKKAENYKISASQVKEACGGLGLEDKIGSIVAELKGAGVMSPKPSKIREDGLKSFGKETESGSPVYDLNPSL